MPLADKTVYHSIHLRRLSFLLAPDVYVSCLSIPEVCRDLHRAASSDSVHSFHWGNSSSVSLVVSTVILSYSSEHCMLFLY